MAFAQAEEARSVPAGPGDLLCDDREALVCATLPQKPAGDHHHFVALALMLANEERADFDMALPLGALFAQRAQHTRRRGAQPAECLFLKTVSQGSRKQVLGQPCRWIATMLCPPERSQLIDIDRGACRNTRVEIIGRRARRPGLTRFVQMQHAAVRSRSTLMR